MMARVPLLFGLFASFLAVSAEAAEGQQGAPAQEQDTVQLVLEREVFNYPAFQRRNPFRPLTGLDEGPRFEDLVLRGVIQTADAGASVALLAHRSDPSRTYRVRVGELLGNSRVLEIRRQEVLMAVEEFGVTENRVLQLQRTEPRPEPSPNDTAAVGADDSETDPPPGGDPDSGASGDHMNGGSSS
jgi:type II secretory pathway component PulC